ncbi:hypothetical protein POSPLADRAFT_1032191 [Postia placenta MAD-698-R-SB12]|nr:hypothetical protein POSPLADRAFT_1032191 [Postia placenta MAD-698-R-SB12]OSX65435.1 hypothetical protein POSPLADRAFT_1032191 [Postia placenta MAD-698-R-SB12]
MWLGAQSDIPRPRTDCNLVSLAGTSGIVPPDDKLEDIPVSRPALHLRRLCRNPGKLVFSGKRHEDRCCPDPMHCTRYFLANRTSYIVVFLYQDACTVVGGQS